MDLYLVTIGYILEIQTSGYDIPGLSVRLITLNVV